MLKRLKVLMLFLCVLPTSIATANSDYHLTLQQNGRALVSETRSLKVVKGKGSLELSGFPSTIEMETLQVASRNTPHDFKVLSTSVEENRLSPSTLLQRNIGKQVTVVIPDMKSSTGRIQKLATILSIQESPVFLIDGAIYSGPFESILYPALANQVPTEPQLTLDYSNNGPLQQQVDLTYLIHDFPWAMNYVLSVNKNQTKGTLIGWASLTNRSGLDYHQAKVSLLAGEPRSVNAPLMRGAAFSMPVMTMAKEMDSVSPEELFTYHLYTLPQPVDIANQQAKQFQLLQANSLAISTRLVGRANALPNGRRTDPLPETVEALLSFRNTSAQGLGMPLPKGTLRIYQLSGDSNRLLGETNMERSAVGNTVQVTVGKAFDITVERVATVFEKTGEHSIQATWEIRLKNSKNTPQTVTLQEILPGSWKIREKSHNFTRISHNMAEFTVELPAGPDTPEVVVKYSFTSEL